MQRYSSKQKHAATHLAIAEESVLTVTVHRSNGAESGRRTTITAQRCSYKKIEQLRAVRSFSWNAVFLKYILGCLCKMVSIRYNKTERSITMEFTGSYRHELIHFHA